MKILVKQNNQINNVPAMPVLKMNWYSLVYDKRP